MKALVIGIILTLYSLLLWVFAFIVWRKGYREWKTNCENRVLKYDARVVDRRESSVSVNSQTERIVTFEFTGRQQEFAVGADVYESMRIGQEGTLGLKKDRFESFEPKSERERADDVYRRMVKR